MFHNEFRPAEGLHEFHLHPNFDYSHGNGKDHPANSLYLVFHEQVISFTDEFVVFFELKDKNNVSWNCSRGLVCFSLENDFLLILHPLVDLYFEHLAVNRVKISEINSQSRGCATIFTKFYITAMTGWGLPSSLGPPSCQRIECTYLSALSTSPNLRTASTELAFAESFQEQFGASRA
jgi:hypothetical protein